MTVAKKMRDFAERSSWIRRMFEKGTQLKAQFGAENVCDFSLGNPDLPPPPGFQEVLLKAAAQQGAGIHGYMPNAGFPAVREAVARQVSKEQGVSLSNNDILLTCGAAGALNVIMKAILDPGDEVIILAPFFVEYHFYIDNHGGKAKVVATNEDFSINLDAIAAAITERTKAVLVNSPNNPTGQVYPAQALAALADLLEKTGRGQGRPIYLLADEPYRKIVFDGLTVPPILAAYSNAIVVSSYSKDLSVPGERIGYIAVHPGIADKEALLGAFTLANRILGFVNAPALMQRVVGELQGVNVDAGRYQRRRDLLCQILANAGYSFTPPKGAFYLFPRSPISDEVQFVALLQEEKILAVPGRGFGAPGYFRLAFCVEESVIEHSAKGFATAMKKAKGG